MDWADIIGLLLAMVAAVGLPLALRSRKRGEGKKAEELCQHLHGIGVKASMAEEGAGQAQSGVKRSWGQTSVGVIKLAGRNIGAINVIGVASQFGVKYFLDYQVPCLGSPGTGAKGRKKTRMVRKKSSAGWGHNLDIHWKGDRDLARMLNLDYRLKDRLLQCDPVELKCGVQVFPGPDNGYARIRTAYNLPSPQLFEAIDIIARRLK